MTAAVIAAGATAGLLLAVAFVRGATSRPSVPMPDRANQVERTDPLVRVYTAHGCEVWVRSSQVPGRRAVRLTQRSETRDDAAVDGAASVS